VIENRQMTRRQTDAGWSLNVAGLALAVAAVALIWTVGTLAGSVDWGAMLSARGAAVAALWLMPVALCALPLAVGSQSTARVLRIVAAVLLGLLTVATFSVFFLPAAVAMVAAAARPGASTRNE
jgi:hypothetical protein